MAALIARDPLTRKFDLGRPLNLRTTLMVKGIRGPSLRAGPDGLWRACRLDLGEVTVRMKVEDGSLIAAAWGKGAESALDQMPEWVGEHDDPSALVAEHRALERAMRQGRGMRLPSAGGLVEVLIPTILAQKVTGLEANRSYRRLTRRYGEPAPGPTDLLLPPKPDRLAFLQYYDFHPLGVERRRAETILRVCREADRINAWGRMENLAEVYGFLHRIPGIGKWTSARALAVVRGDPDAVPVGDFHVPNLVAWALAGEPRATDQRMLELLDPYKGQRGRVVQLLERFGDKAPDYGHKHAIRDFRRQ